MGILSTDEVLTLSRKKQKTFKTNYDIAAIRVVSSTSCDAERLFSKCGLVMSKLRCAVASKSFESRIILMENQEYWRNVYKEPNTYERLKDSRGFRIVQEVLNSNDESIENVVDHPVNLDYELA